MRDDDIDAWLSHQPADAPLHIGAEEIYLKPAVDGAELGAVLYRRCDARQVALALQQGFASALHFGAGLGQREADGALVLSRWLPDVRDWRMAAPALAPLLDQLDYWRAALAPPPTAHGPNPSHERRMRQALSAKGVRQ